ncbi:ferredoxin--NADP reductase [Rhodopirellula europaea]|uniref:ferredoxin--NADP(+) reductase n=1 Tax=Rhodopirellula europaea SH398 TaxID=1263868 RepID=M5S498_9BACT|nr:ferredoxin--NADP reductase [Rhodopirellula europaea]EMI26330.1 ferredoxin--NADP reductase [Rhodopirellula europaea SH398]
MDELDYPDDEEKRLLRERHYNATIIKRMDLTEDLARFRIQCDEPVMPFEPGQYVAIGLGNWEPRLRGTQPEDIPIKKSRKLVRRAYSISCPMLHDAESPKAGELAPVDQIDYLEFYITLVRQGATAASKPPALTPRLFGKGEGDRICVERKITGRYLLGDIPADENVLMLGTGTGEAPHNAMATTLLSRGHRGKVVIATSVRYQSDIAYQSEHDELMRRFPSYCYLPLTTREPKNLEPNRPDYVGKQYLQTMFTTGKLAELVGDPLAPSNTHVFLCGNPDMIGYVPPGGEVPDRPGMLPLLRAAGFHDATETPGPGTIRFEKYW